MIILIIFTFTSPFLNQRKLNEINFYSHFAVAKINKRPIRHARKSEYRGKLKTRPKRTKRSVPKNAKRSVPETFRNIPKAFRAVLEAFRFVQTVQRSRCVVVRFSVCRSIVIYIACRKILINKCNIYDTGNLLDILVECNAFVRYGGQ